MQDKQIVEKKLQAKPGMLVLVGLIIGSLLSIGLLIISIIVFEGWLKPFGIILASAGLISILICFAGIKIIDPKEALVLNLFGQYYGTLDQAGIFFVNPFCEAINPAASTELGQSKDVENESKKTSEGTTMLPSKKISLKIMTLSNNRQKVNDYNGNPIEVGVSVMWRVVNTAQAVFNVDNYKNYLSIQADSAVRDIVKLYPYDVAENVDTNGDGEPDDGSLRGSSRIVAQRIKEELQAKVSFAGIEIVETRITHLAYATEIAAAMLQRQQAKAVVDARRYIVEGAVGMVEMALNKLQEGQTVELDEERKAAMVSNLLVVLCGNKEAQPVVNSGSLY